MSTEAEDKVLTEETVEYPRRFEEDPNDPIVITIWYNTGEEEFSYWHDRNELHKGFADETKIAEPRSLKAARHILKEDGWTIK